MTTGEQLRALADRCEAATRGDRELEAYIRAALFAPNATVRQSPFNGAWCLYETRYDGKRQSVERPRKIPFETWRGEYTTSLDAAMTLVPEGLRINLGEWDDEKHLRSEGPWFAILSNPGQDASFDEMLGYRCTHAATPALALCAASLRALAMTTETLK